MSERAQRLLELADDELVLGWRNSEWTGIAPFLEEDVAFSSIAQNEIGHARALYELAARDLDTTADELAFDRRPEEYRCAPLVELRFVPDWARTIARHYLYESADAVRVAALKESDDAEVAGLMAKIDREETYHRMHADMWIERLRDDPKVREALVELWPYALGVLDEDLRPRLADRVRLELPEAELHQQLADRNVLLRLLEQRDAQLVLGEDPLVDEDLAEMALRLRRGGLVHATMIRGRFMAALSTSSEAREFLSMPKLRRTGFGGHDIEGRAACLGEGERAPVVLEGEARLAQMVEAHGEVVGEIGVVGLGGEGLEIFLLRFRPASLLGELVAEREVQHVRAGVVGEHRLDTRLGRHRVDASAAQRDQRCLRVRVARIGRAAWPTSSP